MSEKSSESSQSQQRRSNHYNNQTNHYRNNYNNNFYRQQQQQHSYNYEQQQQQRRYSSQRYSDSNKLTNNKGKDLIKDKEEDSKSSVKQLEVKEYDYKQQVSTMSMDSYSYTSKTCILCTHNLNTYVTYSCMHNICFHCAIKLRIICEKLDCPACRQPSEHVICTKDTISPDVIETQTESTNRFLKLIQDYKKKNPLKGGFYYNSECILKEYEEILSHRCKVCRNLYFKTFEELDQHMKRTHQMFYCELCTANLKMFTFERKFYNRQQLAQHRREGDIDDQSFKGHPNCDFCDERFFDRDELYRHLRKDHFYCHFCDADGHEEYYENVIELRRHFKTKHYLCEIDDCGLKGEDVQDLREYSVFRTEIDYNAHKKTRHAKSKSEAKTYGKINIEFNVSNPIRDRIRDRNVRGNQLTDNQPFNQQQQQVQQSSISNSTQSLIMDENSHGSSSSKSNDSETRRRDTRQKPSKQQQQQQQQQSNLRDLYEKYEETQETVKEIEETKPSVVAMATPISSLSNDATIASASILTMSKINSELAEGLPSTWRDLISQGPVPKVNLDSEFPTLSTEKRASSLASIGDSIAKQNVWAKKLAVSKKAEEETAKTTKESKKSSKGKSPAAAPELVQKTQHQPRLHDNIPEIDNHFVDLKTLLEKPEPRNTSGETFRVINKKLDDDEELEESTSNKKKDKKKKKKKNEVETNETSNIKSIEKEKETKPILSELVTAPPAPPPPPPPAAAPPGFKKPSESIDYEKELNDSLAQIVVNKNPPPGFHQPIAQQQPILKSFDYVKPQNYDKRNNDLTLKLINLLEGAQFNQFKQISADYHAEKLNARVYLEKCKNILSNELEKYKQFLDLLQEMIILLPNIYLQNQLYDQYLLLIQHNEEPQQKPVKLAWADKSKSSQISSSNRLHNCINCNQLLSSNEVNLHLRQAHGNGNSKSVTPAASTIITTNTSNVNVNEEYPDLPSSSSLIFNNPQESLSLLNKKKYRKRMF